MSKSLPMVMTEPGPNNPGSVTTIFRTWQKGQKAGDVSVPCGDCNACCRSEYLKADLTAEEAAELEHVFDDDMGANVLAKRPDGSCVYLVEGKCSIRDRRPRSCRQYDCRLHLLLGVGPHQDDKTLWDGLRRWGNIRTPTAADKSMLMAIRLAIADGGIPDDMQAIIAKAMRARGYIERAKTFLRGMREALLDG